MIFTGQKFSDVLRNTRKHFRELYWSLFEPRSFPISGLLRNAGDAEHTKNIALGAWGKKIII